jgi:methionine-rich copper-binding protein CopC
MDHSCVRRRGRRPSRPIVALAVGLLITLLVPSAVAAHAELVSSTPAAGEVVTTPPTEVVLRFDEAVVGNSSFSVLDSSGATLATGTPDPADTTTMRATFPPLGAGQYAVQWTSVATDTDVERGMFTFSYAVPAPPVGTPAPTPTASSSTTESPAILPSAAPTDAPSSAGDGSSVGGTQVLLPIAIVGLLVVAGLAYFLRRRGSA